MQLCQTYGIGEKRVIPVDRPCQILHRLDEKIFQQLRVGNGLFAVVEKFFVRALVVRNVIKRELVVRHQQRTLSTCMNGDEHE